MKLAVDVHYNNNSANVGGVTFDYWNDPEPAYEYISLTSNICKYKPGQFFERELPCILKLIGEHDLQPDCIIVDGYVFLDGHSKAGLGKYLFDALKSKIPIIGVAKTPFKGISDEFKVFRGKSEHPLFVTTIGITLKAAKANILAMHGCFRIPTLLKRVDRISKAPV